MQNQQNDKKAKSDQKIAAHAIKWRSADKACIADPGNAGLKRAKYSATQDLRKVVDEAGETP
jgi:hypothetical protein